LGSAFDLGGKMNVSKIKLVAMDLDGTLTQHKEPLDEANKSVLDALAKRYSLLMVGAGQVMRIFNQLLGYPLDVIGNYGLQYGEYSSEDKSIIIKRDLVFPVEKESVTERIEMLRRKFGFTEYRGESVEFHPSGCVTFPILGTKAIQSDKLSFDPDRKKRRAILDTVKQAFPEYTVFIGGSSSFDMSPAPYDKAHALGLYLKEKGFSPENVVYIGDDYGEGGNDESVLSAGYNYIKIDSYKDFPEVTKPLLM
jgi:HAD superfamily hydrolase (TIGR01484 family)